MSFARYFSVHRVPWGAEVAMIYRAGLHTLLYETSLQGTRLTLTRLAPWPLHRVLMLLWPSAEDTIIGAEQKGQQELVSWLLRNAHYDATRLLLDASRLGLPTLVQEVLADTRIGPVVISQALLIACDHGKCKVIRTILAVIAADLRVIDLGRVVERAADGEHTSILRALLNYTVPESMPSCAKDGGKDRVTIRILKKYSRFSR